MAFLKKPTSLFAVLFVLLGMLFSLTVPTSINANTCGELSPENYDNLVSNSGFENSNLSPWNSHGGETLESVTTESAAGCKALKISNRSYTWQGSTQLIQNPKKGNYYAVSFYIKSPVTAEYSLTIKYDAPNGTQFFKPIAVTVPAGEWQRYDGIYRHDSDQPFILYFEQGGGPLVSEFYLDEVIVRDISVPDWRTNANERIEQYRKGDLRIKVLDPQGRPVNNASVQVKQLKNEFGFGTVINRYAEQLPNYREFVLENFEWVTIEDVKWNHVEGTRDSLDYRTADYLYSFATSNDLKIRSHNIFWDSPQYFPSWIPGLSKAQIWEELDERMVDLANRYGQHNLHIDVVNEMMDNEHYYKQWGVEFRRDIHNRVRELNPNAKLFVNEYNMVNRFARLDRFDKVFTELKNTGAPIDGIGVQGHFYEDDIWPFHVEYNLQQLAEYGLPIWITEFDFVHPDPQVRAENLEEFYRVAFSIPEVEGIIFWEFYEQLNWRKPHVGLVDEDWTVNAAGLKYQELREEWKTNTTLTTASNGEAAVRAFYGDFEITATLPSGEKMVTTTQHLADSGSTEVIVGPDTQTGGCAADINQDTIVDLADYSILLQNFLKPSLQNPRADINTDGIVDLGDYSLLVRDFLKSCS